MKKLNFIFAALVLLPSAGSMARAQVLKQAAPIPSRQVIDFWVTVEEKRLLAVAEAMPADKYPFAPTNGEFRGVRTFAQQLKHLASDNYILGAAMLGENPPPDVGDEAGPDSLRTKADVIPYVRDSFTYLHKAVAAIDDANAPVGGSSISPMPKGAATRLGLAVEALMHTFDHYGQLVEYLRMNGIVPPASRLDGGNR